MKCSPCVSCKCHARHAVSCSVMQCQAMSCSVMQCHAVFAMCTLLAITVNFMKRNIKEIEFHKMSGKLKQYRFCVEPIFLNFQKSNVWNHREIFQVDGGNKYLPAGHRKKIFATCPLCGINFTSHSPTPHLQNCLASTLNTS